MPASGRTHLTFLQVLQSKSKSNAGHGTPRQPNSNKRTTASRPFPSSRPTPATTTSAAASQCSFHHLPLHLQFLILIQGGAPLNTCKSAALIGKDPQLTAEWLQKRKLWPLLHAANHQLWDVCQRLLDMGVAGPAPVRYWAAHCAAKAKQSQLVANLLKSAALMEGGRGNNSGRSYWDQNMREEVLTRALRTAAGNNDVPTCKIIIKAAPEVFHLYGSEYSIEDAAYHGHSDVAFYLWEACKEHEGPAKAREWFRAAFRSAVSHGQMGLVRMLLAKIGDVNAGASAFSPESPFGVVVADGSAEMVRLLLKRGGHIHAHPGVWDSRSALLYAIQGGNRQAVKVLLQDKRATVGERELCAAVEKGHSERDVEVLQLLLQSKLRMEQELRESQEERARVLGVALALAVSKCEKYVGCPTCGDWGEPEDHSDPVKVLLAAPAHWGPITPDVLGYGVRAVIELVETHSAGEDAYTVIEMLGKAGADLNMDDGALLEAAIKHSTDEEGILEAMIAAGADLGQHGRLALQTARKASCAALLIKAGVPMGDDAALLEKLFHRSLYSDNEEEDLTMLIGSQPRVTPAARKGGKGECRHDTT